MSTTVLHISNCRIPHHPVIHLSPVNKDPRLDGVPLQDHDRPCDGILLSPKASEAFGLFNGFGTHSNTDLASKKYRLLLTGLVKELTPTDVAVDKFRVLDSVREVLCRLVTHAEVEIVACSAWDYAYPDCASITLLFGI